MDNEVLEQNLPPQNIEAERAVLGAVFFNADALTDAMEYIEASDFYRRAHQLIFQAMVDLNDVGEAIDVLTIQNKLAEKNQVEDVGGLDYLMELVDSVPTAANAGYYAKIVKDKAVGRRLIAVASDIIGMAQEQNDDMPSILDQAEKKVMDVAENTNRAGFKKVASVLDEALNEVYRLSTQQEDITGLATGYDALDKMTAGLQKDNLIIIGARPAVGKTAFVLNIAQNIAISTDKAVAIFSLEMGAESLVNRMLCAEGSIRANNLRTGQLTDEEWDNLTMASGVLSRTNIYIDDTPGIKVAEIRAKCRRLAKETGNLGLVVIDYLQLIEGSGRESRQQEVSEISRQLKKLAKELSVPVIALSQLSRGLEQRQDKRPVLSDIRESGAIEQDADIVAFLYRDDYYEREGSNDEDTKAPADEGANDAGEIEVIIEKNRAGARGTVKLLFLKAYNKFVNITYQQPEGV